MRVSVAGISLDVGDVVWIFDLWAATPVYHRAELVPFPNGEGSRLVTGCGIPTRGRDLMGRLRDPDAVPPKHATKFARPCCTCWPELRAQPSLFTRRSRPGTTRPRQEELIA
jgi:hypothetical protein